MVSHEQPKLLNQQAASGTAPLVKLYKPDADGSSYFDKKFTYEEYLEELRQPIDYPDINDPNDERYYKKYAMNVAPPEAYYWIPDKKDGVVTSQKTKKARYVFFGWNNVTDFEKEHVVELQQYLKEKGIEEMPPMFDERDWIKWVQASGYKIKEAGDKLIAHTEWLRDIPIAPRLNSRVLELL